MAAKPQKVQITKCPPDPRLKVDHQAEPMQPRREFDTRGDTMRVTPPGYGPC